MINDIVKEYENKEIPLVLPWDDLTAGINDNGVEELDFIGALMLLLRFASLLFIDVIPDFQKRILKVVFRSEGNNSETMPSKQLFMQCLRQVTNCAIVQRENSFTIQ